MAAAKSGILCDEDTYNASRDVFEYVALAPIKVMCVRVRVCVMCWHSPSLCGR
jgi:hypothetical protein